jgi:exosome complex component RRP42
MLQITQSEINFLRQGVEQDLRADGRGRLDYRAVTMESGVLAQSNGSSRVVLGNGDTDLLASIKVEVGEPTLEAPRSGRIDVSVECLPSVSDIE